MRGAVVHRRDAMRGEIGPFLAVALALALAGCSEHEGRGWLGGGGTLDLTRSAAPAETYEVQEARARGVFARSDSLIYSAWFGESNHPDYPFYAIAPVCSGPVYTVTDESTGRSDSFDKVDLSDEFGDRRPILTRNGITTIEAFNERLADYEAYTDFRSYGSWLSHSAFAVQTVKVAVELEHGFDFKADVRSSLAGGELTGTRPEGTAAWRGVMVGTTHAGPVRGDILQGDAALIFTMAGGGSMNAAFTDIVNLDRREPHATRTVTFADVPVAGDGTWRQGGRGDRIHGALYGPGHAEAAGIFESLNMVGAFGARREAGTVVVE